LPLILGLEMAHWTIGWLRTVWVILTLTGNNDFDVINDMDDLSVEDGAATLAAFTTLAVVYTLNDMREKPRSLIVCGGGRHNKAMIWMLREHLQASVKTAEEVGWNSDAIEAQAFAYLAVKKDSP